MQRAAAASANRAGGGSPGRATLAALCASFVGIGLARFAYTPLIPALIDGGWFTPSQAVYLGAANLAGYLAGALLAQAMAARASAPLVLRSMMTLATASFFACASPLSFMWYFVWRFAAGLSGGALMVLAAPTVLAQVPRAWRGLAGGVIFTGVGLGIALSGTLVPLLLRWGLVETWFGLGTLALMLTIVAWGGWPDPQVRARAAPARSGEGRPSLPPALPALKWLYLEYGLNAVGLVPHMVFLVDFVARGLDQGLEAGGRYLVLFGLGAMLGPVLAGHLADRIGFGPALRLAFLVQATGVGALAIVGGPIGLALSSIVVGAFVPGIVPLVLGRVHELVPSDRHGRTAAWSLATTAFALGQAGAAYGFSFLFNHMGSYIPLFGLGAAALVLALTIDLVVAARGPRRGDRVADKF
jgi:predicted MFS family arabinose efflux permease